MKKGSITIYLIIILMSIIILINVITESARINAIHAECKDFTYLAADSVLAGYGRQIYEDYGILLVWNNKSIEKQVKKYIQANINLADLNKAGNNCMNTRISSIKMNNIKYVVNEGGKNFVNQISAYMKYAAPMEAVDQLTDLFSSNNKGDSKQETGQVTSDVQVNEEKASEIESIVTETDEEISKLKDEDIMTIFSSVKKRKKFAISIENIMENINEYRKQKSEFFENAKGLNNESDYVDANFRILEQIKDKIEKKELSGSNNSKQDWDSVGKEVEELVKALSVRVHSKKDEENKSLYESAKDMLEKGILSLVVEETNNISTATISDSNLPSDKDNEGTLPNDIKTKAMLALYADMKMSNYMNTKKDNYLNYELEYLICGNKSDRTNLKETVERMVVLRNVSTLTCLVADKEKMAMLSSVSSSATVAIGVPFLEPVVKAVLIEAWALAEAVNDVKTLMKGNKIQIVKTSKSWKTDLKSLLNGDTSGSSGKSAISYTQLAMIMLMTNNSKSTTFRMMDLIHVNVKKKYNGNFDINKCFTGMDMQVNYETAPLFVAMPWSAGSISDIGGAYKFTVKCKKDY